MYKELWMKQVAFYTTPMLLVGHLSLHYHAVQNVYWEIELSELKNNMYIYLTVKKLYVLA